MHLCRGSLRLRSLGVGHRGVTATLSVIKKSMKFPTTEADFYAFVQSYLVCVLSGTGTGVLHLLGKQRHPKKVNELIHFDFLFVGEARSGPQYNLIVKDDFSGYLFLCSNEKSDASSAAGVFMEYFSTFVSVPEWYSDQGPHFCNELTEIMANSMGAKHRLPTACVPWSNGTVEAVCKEVLRVMHVFSLEFDVSEADWTKMIPAIQSIVNNSLSRRLGGRASISVHTRMSPGNALSDCIISL